MKQNDNFPKLNASRTPAERRAAAKKAGKASGEARRRRATMRDDAIAILSAVVNRPSLIEALNQLGIADKNPTIQRAILAGQAIAAIKGNTHAAEYIRDTCGEKPVERIEQMGEMPVICIGEIPEKYLPKENQTGEIDNGEEAEV